ncbi:MAG: aldo/keto reductase [Acidobacteria bacterium]|nr:MAG: aldo/keto reductase [Acidobacteriota bacterium]TDI45042.1 MAG: aldo/keto reductase [Acidobacteriota bacterium]
MIPARHFAAGCVMPAFGLGTWRMGEDPARRGDEVAALRLGLDLGVTLIDTAEMYGDGRAEELVAEAVAGRRDELFLVSKVLPHHAGRTGTVQAAEASLRRLGTDRIDLYLLHWRGRLPLAETLAAFLDLRRQGKIRFYGVSNFDVSDMKELAALAGGDEVAVNQILYNPACRGPERRVIPWCRRRGMGVMAYSPLAEGRLSRPPGLAETAARHGVSGEQVVLAWLLGRDDVVVIPKATRPDHVRDDVAAVSLHLDDEDRRRLEAAFPVPDVDGPLATA